MRATVVGEPNGYLRVRESAARQWGLREEAQRPSEPFLQAIWFHQRLLRDQLRTTDGRPLEVVHPGFPQTEGGPDFCNALLRWEGGPLRRGDIEVDVRVRSWRAHGHEGNPRFAQVVLHVVWEAESSTSRPGSGQVPPATSDGPPVLALRPFLDAPLEELMLWLDRGEGSRWPETLRGACCAPLSRLAPDRLLTLLREAGLARLEAKAAQFQARARIAGWEQAFWEGIFHALGYKHNSWPMRWLAERRPRWWQEDVPCEHLQARLLGLSGLLPQEARGLGTEAAQVLRRLWDLWWRDRAMLEDCCLPRGAWHLRGVRPANHPERRLILAARWLACPDWTRQWERWCTRDLEDRSLVSSLLELMEPGPDPFWSSHWTLRSARLTRPQGLIGACRASELAVNVVLPWLGARARAAGHAQLWDRIRARFLAWPACGDNALLRLARQRLLGGRALRGEFARAAVQQGLIQILRDFCDRANARCEGCGFPAAVEAWRRQAAVP